jgi:hypothetical protein
VQLFVIHNLRHTRSLVEQLAASGEIEASQR